jgi:hypothetical protein
MSYLGWPRLHFAGAFFADPSTVNNDPAHVLTADDPAFDRTAAWEADAGGWWNPDGTHAFQFVDTAADRVTVRSAVGDDGSVVDGDPVLAMRLVSSGRPAAKLVDLDNDQQMVSMVYGLEVTLRDAAGQVFLVAAMEPVPFSDIWRRGSTGSGDEAASAYYQSTLAVTRWGDVSSSPFLTQLRAATGDGPLSVKFTTDGYSMNSAGPGFRRGRIVGTIGVAAAGEPAHTVLGRQFGKAANPNGNPNPGFRLPGVVNFCVGVLDPAARKIHLDLGNALPAATAGGPTEDIGDLSLAYRDDAGSLTAIAPIDYRGAGWYETTAGVVDLPADRALTDDELVQAAAHPLAILQVRNGQQRVAIAETPVHVRADAFVNRLDPTDRWVVRLWVTERGEPKENAQVTFRLRLPAGSPAQFPVGGLSFPASVTTGADGLAEATFVAADPGADRFMYDGTPRDHLDGQLYKVVYEVDGLPSPNPSNQLNVLVFTTYTGAATWLGGLDRILVAYGNLYPSMTNAIGLDLADLDQVVGSLDAIVDRLGLPVTDPGYMPVSRDLSGTRRAAILHWLTNPGPDGRPELGVAPAGGEGIAAAAPIPSPLAGRDDLDLTLGGKTVFALRQED